MKNTKNLSVLNSGKFFLLIFISLTPLFAAAQAEKDTTWTVGGNVGLFLQQVGLSNWAGGGQNSLAYGGEVSLYANQDTDKFTWDNSLQAGYSLIKQGDQGTRKSNDILLVTSKYGRFFNKKWQVSAGLDFRTQFTDGFNYGAASDGSDTLISAFMAPGYLSVYTGITYKPKKSMSFTLSPVTGKFTFVLDDVLSNLGAYGVDPGSKIRSEFGASLAAGYQKEVMENVKLKTNLLLFSSYSKFTNVDIIYDLFINFKVNDFITTNFGLQAIYDDDVDIEDDDGTSGPRLQLRNTLNIGLTFNFGDKLPED